MLLSGGASRAPLFARRLSRQPLPLLLLHNKRCQLLICALVVPIFVLMIIFLHTKAVVDLSAPSSRSGLTRTSTTGRSIRKRINKLFDGEAACEAYGCPLYPGDVADETVRTQIQEVKDVFPRAGKLSLPFGSTEMAACSQRGTTDQHKFNQDRGVLISPYYWKGDAPTSESSTPTSDFFVAIFDGHGDEGHHVSRFLQTDMVDRISKKLSRSTHDIGSASVEQALKEAFIESDRKVPEVYAMNGGSTASLIFRLGSKIYFANAGDSTTFVASYNKRTGETKVVHRNRKDKPHLPEERARIEASGGKVRSPPDHPIQARAMAYNSVRKEMVGLAMSRSIGDWEHGKVGVIAEPTVDVLDENDILGEGELLFAVVGSDGLFDARTPQFVANHLSKSLFGKETEVTGLPGGDRDHPIVECSKLIGIATPKDPKRYRDDITLLFLRM